MSRALDTVRMPNGIDRLPRNSVGYPIPWFVAELPDGVRDFRVADEHKQVRAHKEKLCWICGRPLGSFLAFTIGPMCAINRISSEPPSHRVCAIYSALVCPFLSNPAMRRRDGNLPEHVPAAGAPVTRNPGVALVWVTRSFRLMASPMGNQGLLWGLGDPTETLWYREGRDATRAEILESMDSGFPLLEAACEHDDDPAASLLDVRRAYEQAVQLLPAA